MLQRIVDWIVGVILRVTDPDFDVDWEKAERYHTFEVGRKDK